MNLAHIEQALILAGGRGMRMRRLGEYMPKCALAAYDQPLLVRQLDALRQNGVKKTIISIAPRHVNLVESIIKPLHESMTIELIVDREQRGPIAGLFNLRDVLGDLGHFFLLGDIYFEDDGFFFNDSP